MLLGIWKEKPEFDKFPPCVVLFTGRVSQCHKVACTKDHSTSVITEMNSRGQLSNDSDQCLARQQMVTDWLTNV